MGTMKKASECGSVHDDAPDAEYDDEIMCAGWNPAVSLAQQQQAIVNSGEVSAESSAADEELFLQNIYINMR